MQTTVYLYTRYIICGRFHAINKYVLHIWYIYSSLYLEYIDYIMSYRYTVLYDLHSPTHPSPLPLFMSTHSPPTALIYSCIPYSCMDISGLSVDLFYVLLIAVSSQLYHSTILLLLVSYHSNSKRKTEALLNDLLYPSSIVHQYHKVLLLMVVYSNINIIVRVEQKL